MGKQLQRDDLKFQSFDMDNRKGVNCLSGKGGNAMNIRQHDGCVQHYPNCLYFV